MAPSCNGPLSMTRCHPVPRPKKQRQYKFHDAGFPPAAGDASAVNAYQYTDPNLQPASLLSSPDNRPQREYQLFGHPVGRCARRRRPDHCLPQPCPGWNALYQHHGQLQEYPADRRPRQAHPEPGGARLSADAFRRDTCPRYLSPDRDTDAGRQVQKVFVK